jgi:serine/threonine protein kinase
MTQYSPRSYGVVWRATHQKTGTSTAIKIVPVDNDLEDLFHEISMMKSCKSPYIINYYGSYFRENELWVSLMFF